MVAYVIMGVLGTLAVEFVAVVAWAMVRVRDVDDD